LHELFFIHQRTAQLKIISLKSVSKGYLQCVSTAHAFNHLTAVVGGDKMAE